MIALQPIHTEHALYLFVEKLLHSAFPSDERRDDEQQRAYTDGNDKFRCLLIREFDKPIGLLTYWDFVDFVYVEHFAIDESLRGNGLGEQAMRTFLQDMDRPVVLEVETPRVKGDHQARRPRCPGCDPALHPPEHRHRPAGCILVCRHHF